MLALEAAVVGAVVAAVAAVLPLPALEADALACGANCCRAPRIRCISGDPACGAVASFALVLSPVAAEPLLPPPLRPAAARWPPWAWFVQPAPYVPPTSREMWLNMATTS